MHQVDARDDSRRKTPSPLTMLNKPLLVALLLLLVAIFTPACSGGGSDSSDSSDSGESGSSWGEMAWGEGTWG